MDTQEALVLNTAFELATEWGENFRKPIGDRLSARFPDAGRLDFEKIEQTVREAEYFIYSLGERELAGEITESDITRLAVERFPWLKPDNAARLKNIAMYYARR
ncbi:MAG: hypothetical protein QUS14_09795 [Pyrinomonadaceae bacterium]|nr:hypothetical protein [Pyrinomonadaceae bacterium]